MSRMHNFQHCDHFHIDRGTCCFCGLFYTTVIAFQSCFDNLKAECEFDLEGERCQNCGRRIRIQIFKGSPLCSENCRKETLFHNGVTE